MKKSEIYRAAQFSVLRHEGLQGHEKLEILKELMQAEDLAKFQENREAEQNAK